MPASRDRLLFLYGGMPAMAALPAFLAAAGGEDARIIILAQSRMGWEQQPNSRNEPFLAMLAEGRARLIAPEETGLLDAERACDDLLWATGIHITGGHSPTYRQLFAVEPIRSVIRDRYQAGVPYAGLSAGALLAQDTCIFPPEYYNLEQLEAVPGLGLLPGQVIEVHYDEPERPARLQANMTRLGLPGIGITLDGCALYINEIMARVLCGSAYRVSGDEPPTRITCEEEAHDNCI